MASTASVNLQLVAKPECISLVRGMLAGVAEELGFDGELLDDLKTAVSEACNNAVLHAYSDGPGPLLVELAAKQDLVQILVRDWGKGIHQIVPSDDRMHVGMALISTLADRAEFFSADDGGTEVRMSFARQLGLAAGAAESVSAGEHERWRRRFSGDVVVTLAPIELLGGVLGRLARAVAASSRFTLDRFSDLYLVTDAVAAHAAEAVDGSQISFALRGRSRRLEMSIGPFSVGAGRELKDAAEPESLLVMLADELEVEPVNHHELLRLVMQDRGGAGAAITN